VEEILIIAQPHTVPLNTKISSNWIIKDKHKNRVIKVSGKIQYTFILMSLESLPK
jgi:hypothetical protein